MKNMTYEKALAELQGIVNDLQEDAVSIDHLPETVERAAELSRFCRAKLRSPEENIGGLIKADE